MQLSFNEYCEIICTFPTLHIQDEIRAVETCRAWLILTHPSHVGHHAEFDRCWSNARAYVRSPPEKTGPFAFHSRSSELTVIDRVRI